MYRSKQMQWGNVNANGMSDAVSQAAQATALLQEANKGLSGIGDSLSKVGDSVTKYGTDMETRYNKEKTEIIEGIAHDIYNSAIADSTDANGKVNFDTFDKVVTMGMTSLGQGDYAMDKKDVNSVLKHVNSLMNRSDATKNNVSIGDLALGNRQQDHVEKVYEDTTQKKYSNILLQQIEQSNQSILDLADKTTDPNKRALLLTTYSRALETAKTSVLDRVNQLFPDENKKIKSYSDFEKIFTNRKKLENKFGRNSDYVLSLVYQLHSIAAMQTLQAYNQEIADKEKILNEVTNDGQK